MAKLKSKSASKKRKRVVLKKVHRRYIAAPKLSIKILMLVLVVMVLLSYSLIYMFKSSLITNKVYSQSNNIASSFLAYDKTQIGIAGIIGPKETLTREIKNYYTIPRDLQNFVLADYKAFKRNCIANLELTDKPAYEIINTVYDKYALVNKDCNGSEKSYLAKISENWTVVYSGNEIISCDMVNVFSIPKGITTNCATNRVIYTNPNP
jgi:hypothetical protein